MSLKLFKRTIKESIVNKSGLSTAVIEQLNQTIDSLSGTIPVDLTKDSDFYLNGSLLNHSVEKINIPLASNKNIKKIKKLHNGDFVILFTDEPIKQYNSDFVLQGDIPFKFAPPSLSSVNSYFNPNDMDVAIVANSSGVKSSYLFIAQSEKHIVQVYKYENDLWTFYKTIGTIDESGHDESKLDLPIAVSSRYKSTSTGNQPISYLETYISCNGTAPNNEISFIKKIVINLSGGTIENSLTKAVSYPKQVISVTSIDNGSLIHSETSSANSIEVIDDDLISVILNDKKEFGIIKFYNSTLPTTIAMIKEDQKTIEYNDVIKNPTCFDVNLNTIVLGDELGHIYIMDKSLNKIINYFGKNKEAGIKTDYPGEYSSIDSILIDGNIVYFISDKNVYKSNVLSVLDSEFVFVVNKELSGISNSYTIQDIFGVSDYQEVLFSKDGLVYYDMDVFRNKIILSNESLYIKVKVSKENILKSIVKEPRLLLLLNI